MSNKIITIWGNSEFGCEFSYCMAKYTNKNVLLVDMDLLMPTVDIHLGIPKYPEKIVLNKEMTGFDILIDAVEKNYISEEIIANASIKKNNLYVITGNYDLNNYEYYSEESILKVIENCQCFDITVFIVNRSIYDFSTCAALLKSDIVLIPVEALMVNIRSFNNDIMFLKNMQDIDINKYKFVAFDYNSSKHEPEGFLHEVTQNSFLSCISNSKKRDAMRISHKSYVTEMESKIQNEYKLLISKLGYIPKIGLLDRMKLMIKGINQ